MLYQEALDWLSGFQFHGIKPGLERISRLLKRLGNPERRFLSIHLAGTNGKGSTAAMIEAVLRAHGLKTGLYTSPHLISVRERFLVSGNPISREDFVSLCKEVKKALGDDQATYFELTTAMAFLWFAEQRVDWAVIECGLGGRLDATNVILPEVTVITNVGLDHQAYLGESLREIAFEKAGIIKEEVPIVTGPLKKEALEVIEEKARQKKAPLFRFGKDFKVEGERPYLFQGRLRIENLIPSLRGQFQVFNLGVALKTLECLPDVSLNEDLVREALARVSWPGRYEKLRGERLVILDGAHNLDGIRALKETLQKEGINNFDLLYAASNEGGTKPFLEMLKILIPHTRRLFLCEPPGPRHPVAISIWQQEFSSLDLPEVFLQKNWKKALFLALQAKDLPLVVTGSLYLVGKVRNYLLSRGYHIS